MGLSVLVVERLALSLVASHSSGCSCEVSDTSGDFPWELYWWGL